MGYAVLEGVDSGTFLSFYSRTFGYDTVKTRYGFFA